MPGLPFYHFYHLAHCPAYRLPFYHFTALAALTFLPLLPLYTPTGFTALPRTIDPPTGGDALPFHFPRGVNIFTILPF